MILSKDWSVVSSPIGIVGRLDPSIFTTATSFPGMACPVALVIISEGTQFSLSATPGIDTLVEA